MIDLPPVINPDRALRQTWYDSPRWKSLRWKLVRDHPKCLFCGERSRVGEHLLGHGADAANVHALLRPKHLVGPDFEPDWHERFWRGPFTGSCQSCARTRSGWESKGDLTGWTRDWLFSL